MLNIRRTGLEITVGVFGFGKTGKNVTKELLGDDVCKLEWVIRKSHKDEGEYASCLLGLEGKRGRIYSVDSINKSVFFKENFVDVIIDFSIKSAIETYEAAANVGTRIVSAISSYDEKQIKLLKRVGKKTAVLYSPNITLGINFLIEISKLLQRIVPDADIEIIEEHFREKPDYSGTALRIAEDLGLDKERHVNSIRVGGIVGKHEVIFGLQNQTIRITHESLNRAAFGQGAIYAAKWLIAKPNGIYTMEEAVHLNFARKPKSI